MSEENNNQTEEREQIEAAEKGAEETEPQRRRFFTRRNAGISAGVIGLLLVLVTILVIVSYRYGVFDNYVKEQFVAKMDRIGITFTADTFRVRVAPLKLELRNATFNNKVTGEKLAFVREADLFLTVQNLYAWQLSRDIKIDTTDINGIDVYVNFDANGKSNFAELNFVEEKGRVNFLYESTKFSLKDGRVHFGDVQRQIAADANNIVFTLEPTDYTVPDDQKRYKFDFTSTDSNFAYDQTKLENIDLKAQGIADRQGTEITGLRLVTPIGESNLKGTTAGWESPKYDLEIESTVDLTQASTVFPTGTPLRGIGNFKGTVTGEGENYKVNGEINSESLSASNIYLKGLNVTASVDGQGTMYEANGKAIAQMLTFEDFKIDYPQLIGMIRGTGTDFRWVGELQAAAAKTPFGTIGGLFISDAVAEYKEQKFNASFGSTRARTFASKGFEMENVQVSSVKLDTNEGVTTVSAPTANAGKFKTKAFQLENVKTRNLKIKDVPARTDIQADQITSDSATLEDNRLRNVVATDARIGYQDGNTTFTSRILTAQELFANGATVGEVIAYNFNVRDVPAETIVAADNLKVAKVETRAAVLGTLNIAGVRLTVRQGRIEGTSGDIDAGNIALVKTADLPEGGNLQNVKIYKPVFVLEPSGSYRASADMSLGGGTVGSIKLGAARAAVVVDNNQVALNNLTADVMDGKLNGNATIALNKRSRSEINADFTNLDLGKLLALQGGRVVPVEGSTTGKVNFTFAGRDFKTATGSITADITANAGTAQRGLIPVTGRVEATGTNGFFNVSTARLSTENSEFNANGTIDFNPDPKSTNSPQSTAALLKIKLTSTDAREIDRIVRVLNISPEFEQTADEYRAEFTGNFTFEGTLEGNVSDPAIKGTASLDNLALRGRNLGTLTTAIDFDPFLIKVDGRLQERAADGGNLDFNLTVPRDSENNTSVTATLNNINTGNFLAALPILQGNLPAQLQDFQARTSGTITLKNIPDSFDLLRFGTNRLEGEANLSSSAGTINGQPFDGFDLRATFQGSLVRLENFNARFGSGYLRATGNYATDTTVFDFNIESRDVPFARIRPFIPGNESIPDITGNINLTATAVGRKDDSQSYEINFNGTGTNVTFNGNALGEIVFNGKTENQQLTANLTANFEGQQQNITANVNFADPNLPFRAETTFNNTELAPFIAIVRQPGDIAITGQATGRIFLEGNLSRINITTGEREFTTDNLKGSADFTQLALQIGDTPITATEPVAVRFDTNQIVVESAKFAGGGTNLTVDGTIALRENGNNNLSINGRINLSILNAVSPNAFFAGLADVNVRLTGPNQTARLNGTAVMQNASASAFIGTERISFERLQGRVIFTSNQVQIDELTGFLGGGKFTASGGAMIGNNLQLDAFRFVLTGTNVTVPLPKDFLTTGDAEIEINGRREVKKDNNGKDIGTLSTFIGGRINARRSLYTENIDLADVISGRSEGSIAQSGGGTDSTFGDINLDLTIEGRNALVVRNNIADLTASLSLRISGDLDAPQVQGRISADRGTLFYRNDRYEVQRGELVFPPNSGGINPIINLQAETEIAGYQIFLNLNGPLTETENLSAQLRSNPALPQPDVISLITTGSLSNTEGGIPTLAQSGLSTAAEILTDEIINKPIAKATDKLFGLNRFQLDPIISGTRNPGARLTVGRQINRNLAVTYSTNLSEDQNQVLAVEYRVSNRLSFVAQYEQRALSNATQNRNNFSFEIRLRKRF